MLLKHLKVTKVKETYSRLKILLNELENKDVKIPQAKVNVTFVNNLPKKWVSMNQTQRANNYIKNDSLATLFGKYNYEEELIDQIYEFETKRFTILTSILKSLISNTYTQDNDSDVEEETKSNNEGVTRVKAFMAIAEDEQLVGKTDVGETSIKVTLYQLLTEQVPSNIVRALGGRGKRKETIPSKGVLFTKGENSPSKTSLDVTSDTEFVNDNQQPLPPLPKLLGAEPVGTSNDVISHVDLIQISMLFDNTKHITKKKLIIMYVKKISKTKTPSILDHSPEKKANSSTKQLLLTMMKEVK
ncbi:hypothetical protein Tco_0782662 [Tanacetum coccineum]